LFEFPIFFCLDFRFPFNSIISIYHFYSKRKLPTLNEEDGLSYDDGGGGDNDSSDQFVPSNINQVALYNAPMLSESTVNALLEQAKNEGLYPVVDTNRSDSSNFFNFFHDPLLSITIINLALLKVNTERSYYEEALEILQNRQQRQLTNGFFSDRNGSVTPTNEPPPPSSGVDNGYSNSPLFHQPPVNGSADSVNASTKLPPLPIGKSFSDDSEDQQQQSVSRPASASSLSLKNSTITVFPKIDSRFLPK
jgi:hypothetical protein